MVLTSQVPALYLCDLSRARLIETILTNCTLDSVNVYGISAWGLIGEPASQQNLRISSPERHGCPQIASTWRNSSTYW